MRSCPESQRGGRLGDAIPSAFARARACASARATVAAHANDNVNRPVSPHADRPVRIQHGCRYSAGLFGILVKDIEW